MKKKDILRIINLNKKIIQNHDLISLTKHQRFPSLEINEESWFPDIPDLNSDFEILKQEIKGALEETKTSLEELELLTKDCQHEVRLQVNSFLTSSSTCVFCKKAIHGDNTNNGNTIYNDINRNRNCVMFTKSHYDESYYIEGYTIQEVYAILLKILETKNDNDEINLIQEIKKLTLNKCYVDEREKEKEYYVLIIGGSNKEKINENCFMTNTTIDTSFHLAKLLGGIPKVKVELLENPETYQTQEFKKIFPYKNINGYRFLTYSSINELKENINIEKHVPFDLIINASNLQELNLNNNQITTQEHNLSLKKLFPNSFIIDIRDYHTKDEKEILTNLKQKLLSYDDSYSYLNIDQYTHLNQESLEKQNLDKISQSFKKILSKK